ncbi:MAG: DUF2891 domain-containing protein [Pseudomonadota bacterium]
MTQRFVSSLAMCSLLGILATGCAQQTPPAPSARPAPTPTVPSATPPRTHAIDTLPAGQPIPPSPAQDPLTTERVEQLLNATLACIHREYPHTPTHRLESAVDVLPPSELHPAFYGCVSWHSSIQGHWLLTRLARLFPELDSAAAAREALFESLSVNNLALEVDNLAKPTQQGFEQPYGLAWLLQLDLELAEWAAEGDAFADQLSGNLEGVVTLATQHLKRSLLALSHPVRSGTHSQTAFALSLYWDWALAFDQQQHLELIRREAWRFYGEDEQCPLHYEPSGRDFLSPCLAEADLMRRVLDPLAYRRWLAAFLPQLASADDELSVAGTGAEPAGQPARFNRLNLSRAWMLEGIGSALDADDARLAALYRAVARHRRAGLQSIIDPSTTGGHGLGSFATYLLTQRGIRETIEP